MVTNPNQSNYGDPSFKGNPKEPEPESMVPPTDDIPGGESVTSDDGEDGIIAQIFEWVSNFF